MSFGESVYGIIRRERSARRLLNLRREHAKGLRKKSVETDSSMNSNMTIQELERINQQLEEHEQEEQRYFVRISALIFCIVSLILVSLWGIIIFVTTYN